MSSSSSSSISKNSVHRLIEKFSQISNNSTSKKTGFLSTNDNRKCTTSGHSLHNLHSLIETKLKDFVNKSDAQISTSTESSIKTLSLKQQVDIINKLTQRPSELTRNLLFEFKCYFEAGRNVAPQIVDLNSKLDCLVQEVELMLVSLQGISYLQKGFEVMKGRVKRIIDAMYFIEKAAECIRYAASKGYDNKGMLSEIDSLLQLDVEVSLEEEQQSLNSIESSSRTTTTNHSEVEEETTRELSKRNSRRHIGLNQNQNISSVDPSAASYTVFEIYEDKIISKTKFINSNENEEKSIILQYEINL